MIGGSRAGKRAVLIVDAGLLMLAVVAGSSARHASASGPPDTYVTNWDAVAMQALAAGAASPTDGFVVFANLDIAVHDSVVAIEGGHQPFAVDVDVPDASPEAAVAAAAHRVLVHCLPSQASTILDPAYTASLANEVKQIGSSTNSTRTAEPTLAARFWGVTSRSG